MAEALCLKLIILLVSLELAVLVFLIFLLWSCAKVYEHLKMSECGVATERLTIILKTAQQINAKSLRVSRGSLGHQISWIQKKSK